MFQKILVGYDGSKGGKAALERAAALARESRAELVALWVSGATDATYTIMGATTNNAGDYTAVISNSFGQITSGPATLTVLVPFPGIYNTGISDNRVVLDDDLLDPHYRLVLNANDSTSSDAFVEDASVGSLISGRWIPNNSKSKWIGPLPDTTSTASGNYNNGADGPIGLRLDNMVLAGVTGPPGIHLTINSSNGTISISWDQAGTLQSADQVTGPYNTVPGVNGNSFQAQANASKQKFYRVSSPQN